MLGRHVARPRGHEYVLHATYPPSCYCLLLLLLSHQGSSSKHTVQFNMKLLKLPGRKAKKRGVQKASKERGARRKVCQVGKAMLAVILQLIRLEAMPKFPLENASDCLILALFMLELFKSGCPCDVVCLLFLAARHMRTPSLVHELLKRALKQKLRSVARAAIFMESELSKEPFSSQKTGAPFWPGFHLSTIQL